MRRAELLILLAGFAATVLHTAASAQSGPPSAVPSAVAPVPPAATDSQPQPMPPSRWTPDQIRQAFSLADTDGNGQLTRAEAQRLAIMPRSFEDMDENKDGAIVLREYEAAFRP